MNVTIHRNPSYTRYCAMPGFFEAWTYPDGRPAVYAEQCAPTVPAAIPCDVLVSLWDAMNRESGFVPTETARLSHV